MARLLRPLLIVAVSLLVIAAGRAAGTAIAEYPTPPAISSADQDYFVYLPLVHKAPNACEAIPGVSYTHLGVVVGYEPGKPPPENNPDYSLLLLGYDWVDEYKGLVLYGGDTDQKAPQFYTMFTDERTPAFVNTYRAHGWDWENHRPLPPPSDNPWPVTVLGVGVQPKEIILTPDSGYDIQYGNDAMVIYASEREIALKYTRDDRISYPDQSAGYTIYITGICVEPSLRDLYNQLNAAGRQELPVLRGRQPLGRAWSYEVGIAIRDNGMFGDPRSCKDHWQGRCP
ncbi:MAG: hypothetical protein H5T61_05225 [Thermoflexales bacterium]|nr:hypothetical protein [Thermoflexales bacterium]